MLKGTKAEGNKNRVAADIAREEIQRPGVLSVTSVAKHWELLGTGSAGAKAWGLIRKTPAIVESGFELGQRIVFCMDLFKAYPRTGLSENVNFLLIQTAERLEGMPVVVRASAHGDSRGTGVYKSVRLPECTYEALRESVNAVLASQFTPEAQVFRAECGLPEGMAIIIEPLVGKWVTKRQNERAFASNFGGFSYSSTSWGDGYAKIVAGLPLQEDLANNGMVVKASEASRDLATLGNIEASRRDQTRGGTNFMHSFLDLGNGVIDHSGVRFFKPLDINTELVYGHITMKAFFDGMAMLERRIGKPQYSEFAGILEGGDIRWTLLQIADFSPRNDFFEFPENPASLIISSTRVKGAGKRECDKLVLIRERGGLEALRALNGQCRDYILVYDGKLTVDSDEEHLLNLSNTRNATVVVELPTIQHERDPIEHWGTQLRDTGKLMLVLTSEERDSLQLILGRLREEGKCRNEGGIEIYDTKTRTTASERQQKAIVEILG